MPTLAAAAVGAAGGTLAAGPALAARPRAAPCPAGAPRPAAACSTACMLHGARSGGRQPAAAGQVRQRRLSQRPCAAQGSAAGAARAPRLAGSLGARTSGSSSSGSARGGGGGGRRRGRRSSALAVSAVAVPLGGLPGPLYLAGESFDRSKLQSGTSFLQFPGREEGASLRATPPLVRCVPACRLCLLRCQQALRELGFAARLLMEQLHRPLLPPLQLALAGAAAPPAAAASAASAAAPLRSRSPRSLLHASLRSLPPAGCCRLRPAGTRESAAAPRIPAQRPNPAAASRCARHPCTAPQPRRRIPLRPFCLPPAGCAWRLSTACTRARCCAWAAARSPLAGPSCPSPRCPRAGTRGTCGPWRWSCPPAPRCAFVCLAWVASRGAVCDPQGVGRLAWPAVRASGPMGLPSSAGVFGSGSPLQGDSCGRCRVAGGSQAPADWCDAIPPWCESTFPPGYRLSTSTSSWRSRTGRSRCVCLPLRQAREGARQEQHAGWHGSSAAAAQRHGLYGMAAVSIMCQLLCRVHQTACCKPPAPSLPLPCPLLVCAPPPRRSTS